MTAMSRATRRNVVMHLMRDGMTVPQIASELGVSRDTVRRDAEAARQESPQDAQDAQQVMRPDAAPVAPQVAQYERKAEGACLLLPKTAQTARDLEVLCAAYRARPEDAARFAIHEAARRLSAWQAARAHSEGRRTA